MGLERSCISLNRYSMVLHIHALVSLDCTMKVEPVNELLVAPEKIDIAEDDGGTDNGIG